MNKLSSFVTNKASTGLLILGVLLILCFFLDITSAMPKIQEILNLTANNLLIARPLFSTENISYLYSECLVKIPLNGVCASYEALNFKMILAVAFGATYSFIDSKSAKFISTKNERMIEYSQPKGIRKTILQLLTVIIFLSSIILLTSSDFTLGKTPDQNARFLPFAGLYQAFMASLVWLLTGGLLTNIYFLWAFFTRQKADRGSHEFRGLS